MKKVYLLLSVLCTCLYGWAQTSGCITPPLSANYYEKLKTSVPIIENYSANRNNSILRNVSLNINIMVYASGPITTVSDVQKQIDTANIYFANAGIEFSICNVNYIVYAGVYPFWDASYEYQIGAIYDMPGCLNIYYVDYVVNASAYAYYPAPYSPDRIVMGQHLSGEIFAHELGHSFNLIHTHGNFNVGNGTDELVNGSNCTTAADLICDTPADPNLYLNRIDSLCNYIDTVSTDSLGFLYAPDTRNIMSYTLFKCYDHFTQQQYNRIAYTLAHERAYLKSGEHSVANISAPSTLCIYDAPITLTANPAGGVFSGAGVSGSQFDPAAAGPGIHIISYTTPGSTTNPETTDQYYAYGDTTYSLNNAWQSFTTTTAENLVAFSFNLKSSTAQALYITVFDSVGTSGTVLMQDTINMMADSVFNWNKLTFQNPLHLNAGAKYTVQVTALNTFDLTGNRYNVYPAGETNATNDLSFISHVLTDVPICGNNAYAAINVSAPPAPVITNLYPVYCINAPAQPINANPGGGIATIDGLSQTTIDPFTLGAGIHTLHYTYTDFAGCTNDSTFTFLVNDTTDILANFSNIICTNDSIINLTGIPAGGNFYIDSTLLSSSQIDPAALSPGQHLLSYTYNAEYPWIDTVDQDNYFSSSNSSYALSFGQTAWQSFTAGEKGYLNLIDFGLYISDTVASPYKLYKGQGTSGQLLFADTTIISNNSSYDKGYVFPAFQILLEKDSVYTFEVGINPVINNTLPYNDSVYTRGVANFALFGLPNADFKFRTHINSVYQCGQDSVVKAFAISSSPSVNLGNDIVLPVGQPVILDAGNPGCTYVWSTGDITQTINISGPTGSHVIYVTATNPDGCSATDTIVVDFITGIRELNNVFTISPNPVDDVLTVHSSIEVESIKVMNIVGQEVIQLNEPLKQQGIFKLKTEQLTSGVYVFQIALKDSTILKRFVKK